MRISTSGQAMLEFVICFPAVLATVAASVLLFESEWNRIRCAQKAFHAAHRALRSSSGFSAVAGGGPAVKIDETEQGAIAQAYCGRAVETVALPRLENAVW